MTASKSHRDAADLSDEERSALKRTDDAPPAEGLKLTPEELKWWRDARFGLFIHWGLYAIPGRGEWVMHNEKIPAEEYAKLADAFTAERFDASAWAAIAKDAGMKYMVLTARHHDGFALWDSPSSYRGFNSMNSAAQRDIVAEYVKACRGAGLKVGIYYSPMDWRFPAYFQPKALPENAALMKKQGYDQVRELMSNYGRLDILWYDGGWLAHTGTDADAAWFWEPRKLNAMVRKLQPEIVMNDRSGIELDFANSEGKVGPFRTDRPWESCLTLAGAWGYQKNARVRTLAECVRLLVDSACRDGNLLLNVGPRPDGRIEPDQAERLREMGRWLAQYGESIYETRGGPLPPSEWGGTTWKANTLYAHVTCPGTPCAARIAIGERKILSWSLLTPGTATIRFDGNDAVFTLRPAGGDIPDSVIRIVFDRPAGP